MSAKPVHRVDKWRYHEIEIWQGAKENAPRRALPAELFAQEKFATEATEGCLGDRIHDGTLHEFADFTKR